jgi:cation diffusion facilitator CzcD-associated flavoprotein CzcO
VEVGAETPETASRRPTEHLDVLIVGAGISGVGAACHLRRRLPRKSFAILEARAEMGGTWDLFRYPGIRSDSDMHTLGYRFRPWPDEKTIADGASILRYIRETAREYRVDEAIRYHHRVVRAEWSSADSRWTVEVERGDGGGSVTLSCGFLFVCGGYYRYDEGHSPRFPGMERYGGELIHPQHWPEDLDHAGRRVVVIGSGATAVTLVPALAESAAHVTMLQRSPTYIVSLPAEDPLAVLLRRRLPPRLVYPVVRWKNVLLQMFSYRLSRRWPGLMKRFIRQRARRLLPPGYDVDTHFRPSYEPWDQRLCVVPNSDLFAAISEGRASVVTDRIDAFTESGIRLESGIELEADIVVSATGLNLLFMGGVELAVDGETVDKPGRLTYRGMMLDGVPNMAFATGYTNASWTLKVDLVSEYVCRLLAHMDAAGYASCTPERGEASIEEEPILDFTAGYVLRSLDQLPKQGSRRPWRLRQNYALDLAAMRFGRVDDGTLRFSKGGGAAAPAERIAA